MMGVPVGDMEQRLGVAEDVDGIEGGRMSTIVQEPIVLLIVHQRRERIVDGEPVKEGGRPRNGVQTILIQSRRRLKEGRGLEELIKGRRKQSFSTPSTLLRKHTADSCGTACKCQRSGDTRRTVDSTDHNEGPQREHRGCSTTTLARHQKGHTSGEESKPHKGVHSKSSSILYSTNT